MLLIHPQFSPITAFKLYNCFEVTIDLMMKSLRRLPSSPATELGRLNLCLKCTAQQIIVCVGHRDEVVIQKSC